MLCIKKKFIFNKLILFSDTLGKIVWSKRKYLAQHKKPITHNVKYNKTNNYKYKINFLISNMYVQNKIILSQNLKIHFKTKSRLYNLNALKKSYRWNIEKNWRNYLNIEHLIWFINILNNARYLFFYIKKPNNIFSVYKTVGIKLYYLNLQ